MSTPAISLPPGATLETAPPSSEMRLPPGAMLESGSSSDSASLLERLHTFATAPNEVPLDSFWGTQKHGGVTLAKGAAQFADSVAHPINTLKSMTEIGPKVMDYIDNPSKLLDVAKYEAENPLHASDVAGNLGVQTLLGLGTDAATGAVTSRMPAMSELTGARAQAIRDAGTKAVRVATRGTNAALKRVPEVVGGAAGAYAGHASGIPEGGLLGAIAGRKIGAELLPAPQLSSALERFGLPDRVAGGPETVAEPLSLSQLNGTAPRVTPVVTPKAVEAQLSDALGAKPLLKNVPLRSQLQNAAKATEAKLPEGFTPVNSSAMRGYKYDPATREFESISKDGSHYIHGDVSPEEVQAFENADSKGRAWNKLMDQNVRVAKVVNGKRVASVKTGPRGATPEDVAPGDLTPALKDSLRNAQNLPKDSAGKPIRFVYRARDVGEEGVPVNNFASATTDAEQAAAWAEPGNRSATQGQVVKIDLSKLAPEDYIVKPHPDGMSWIQFTRPLAESDVVHFAGASKNAGK